MKIEIQTYTDANGETQEILYYNEMCAECRRSADMHSSTDTHKFARFNPPQPAYGSAWWLMTEEEGMKYHRSFSPERLRC